MSSTVIDAFERGLIEAERDLVAIKDFVALSRERQLEVFLLALMEQTEDYSVCLEPRDAARLTKKKVAILDLGARGFLYEPQV